MKSFQEQSLFLPFDLGSPPEHLRFSSLPPSIIRFFISNDGLLVKFFLLILLIIASFVWTFWFGLVNFFFFSVRLISMPRLASCCCLLCCRTVQWSLHYFSLSRSICLLNLAPSVLSNVLWLVLTGNFQKKKTNKILCWEHILQTSP